MRIEHVAIWTNNLENLKAFYVKYFKGVAGVKYVNTSKKFESYFLTFNAGPRLELMTISDIETLHQSGKGKFVGYAHLAFSVGTKDKVDNLTEFIRSSGIEVIDGPRYTGDGYYESVILDPDGNRIEITI